MNNKSPLILICIALALAGCKPQPVAKQRPAIEPMPANRLSGLTMSKTQPTTQEVIEFTPASPDTNLYDIVYDDTPIAYVLHDFAQLTNVNIIADPANLDGRVTVRLTEVEWKPALNSILDMCGLDLIEKSPGSGVYSVVMKSPGAPPPLITTTLRFDNSNETVEIAGAIRDIWGSHGTIKVAAVPSRKAVILQGTEASIYEIKCILGEIGIEKHKE